MSHWPPLTFDRWRQKTRELKIIAAEQHLKHLERNPDTKKRSPTLSYFDFHSWNVWAFLLFFWPITWYKAKSLVTREIAWPWVRVPFKTFRLSSQLLNCHDLYLSRISICAVQIYERFIYSIIHVITYPCCVFVCVRQWCLNCRLRHVNNIKLNHRSYEHYLSSKEMKPSKGSVSSSVFFYVFFRHCCLAPMIPSLMFRHFYVYIMYMLMQHFGLFLSDWHLSLQ